MKAHFTEALVLGDYGSDRFCLYVPSSISLELKFKPETLNLFLKTNQVPEGREEREEEETVAVKSKTKGRNVPSKFPDRSSNRFP